MEEREVISYFIKVADSLEGTEQDELADMHDKVLGLYALGKVKLAVLKTMIKEKVLYKLNDILNEVYKPGISFGKVWEEVSKYNFGDVPESDLQEVLARMYDVKKRRGIAM